jgi:hypothetical protein
MKPGGWEPPPTRRVGRFPFQGKAKTPEEMAAARAKADFILRSYRRMVYDAVLPGKPILQVGSPSFATTKKRHPFHLHQPGSCLVR